MYVNWIFYNNDLYRRSREYKSIFVPSKGMSRIRFPSMYSWRPSAESFVRLKSILPYLQVNSTLFFMNFVSSITKLFFEPSTTIEAAQSAFFPCKVGSNRFLALLLVLKVLEDPPTTTWHSFLKITFSKDSKVNFLREPLSRLFTENVSL